MQTNMEQVEKWSLFPVTTDSQNRVHFLSLSELGTKKLANLYVKEGK